MTRLLSFDELRNDLVATVAHEFRTPLTSLRMAIHLLHEQAVGALSEKQADLVHAAREDCERLQAIVDELLDLSRIHAGRLVLRSAPHDVEALVRRALEAQRAGRGRAQAWSSCREVLPGQAEVRVDAERIALVFANLLSQRDPPQPAGRARCRCARAATRRRSASRSSTGGRACRANTGRRSSRSTSSCPTRRPEAPVWASSSRARSCAPTAARSASSPRPGGGSVVLVHAPASGLLVALALAPQRRGVDAEDARRLLLRLRARDDALGCARARSPRA